MTSLENKAMSLYYLICGYKENWKPEYQERVDAIQKELNAILDKISPRK